MDGLVRLPARRLATLIATREVSSAEVVDACIARIDAVNPTVNAVVEVRFEAARREAVAADRALAEGIARGALHGVPCTVKEAIAVAGMHWTNGSRLTADRVASADAGAVRYLRAAGAIVLATTNVPEFCSYYDTDNDVYGRTCNPHALERSPGGSSGGEVVAVATGMAPLGVGSDLGSSIRQPAAWTGVFGMRPSRGAIPFDGHAGLGSPPGWRMFGTIGPIARTADDLDLGAVALAGRPLAPPSAGPFRIAVFEEDGLQPVAGVCRKAVRRAAGALEQAGHDMVDAAPPGAADVRATFDTVLLTELAVLAADQPFDQDRLSRYGRMVAEARHYPTDLRTYVAAASRLADLEAAADAWFDEHPVALCPTVPVTAPLASDGITTADGAAMNAGGKLTLCTYANALGLPAVSVPAGRDPDGLPLAVQVIGRRGRDLEVIGIARQLDEALGGWLDPADALAAVVPRAG